MAIATWGARQLCQFEGFRTFRQLLFFIADLELVLCHDGGQDGN